MLGRGGMGSVHEAEEQSMHRRVALKLLDASAGDAADVTRFVREAWIGGRLSHPNVVRVHGHGIEGDVHFISMELAEGGTLHDEIAAARLQRAESPTAHSGDMRERTRRMAELFAGVADALDHVHAQGIVHRDIKPLNLLFSADRSRLMLSDFGLARDPDASRLTRRGDFMGTLRYMSPEQLLAHRAGLDHRTDIWSLGVSLYEAVTLALPFEAADDESLIAAIATKEPAPASRRDRRIPRDLETILMKCLERDASRRYATAGELRDDLRRFLEDRPPLARRAGPLHRVARAVRRHRLALGAALAAAVLVGAGSVAIVRTRADRAELAELRDVLERTISSRRRPADLDPQWPRLEARLEEERTRRPGGEMDILARRAAMDALVRIVPMHGLVAEHHPTPEVWIWPRLRMDRPYAVALEASWDGAAWQPMGWARWLVGDPDRGHALPIPPEQRRTGPHRVDVRATFALYDTDLPAEMRGVPGGAGDIEAVSPRWRQGATVETRELGGISFMLFDRYPESFPARVDVSPEQASDALPFTKVLILATVVPAGGGEIAVRDWIRPLEVPDGTRGLIPIGLQLYFDGTGRVPHPLSGRLSVVAGDAAILGLPMTIGELDASSTEASDASTGPTMFSAGCFTGIGGNGGEWVASCQCHAPLGGELVQPLPTRGMLTLEPSRDMALDAGFSSYVASAVSVPVTIEIATLPSTRR
jgi:hypothetical protein